MTPRGLRNIHTTENSCRGAIPCPNMTLQLPQYFHLLMEKPLGCYFQVRSPNYQVAQPNQKTPIPNPQGDRSGLRKPKKRIIINTNHSYHQHSSPCQSQLI